MSNQIKSITINVREVRDSNGNTYHGGFVRVVFKTPRIESDIKAYPIPFQYGGSHQYLTSAFEVLQAEGLLPSGALYMRRWCSHNGVALHENMQQVQTEALVKELAQRHA